MSKMSERAIDKMNKTNNLNTLKDIDFKTYGYEDDGTISSAPYQTENEIKETLQNIAKQHIQSIQLAKDKTTNIADMIIADRKIEWIKYFFNLKEVNNVE